MSDDDRIIDTTMLVLKNFHLYDHGYDEDDLSDIATHILAALREDNIELVKLPKPDEGRDDWLDGTVWVDLTAKTTPIATEETQEPSSITHRIRPHPRRCSARRRTQCRRAMNLPKHIRDNIRFQPTLGRTACWIWTGYLSHGYPAVSVKAHKSAPADTSTDSPTTKTSNPEHSNDSAQPNSASTPTTTKRRTSND